MQSMNLRLRWKINPDAMAIALLTFFLCLLLFVAAINPGKHSLRFNFGLGRDWQCQNPGYGEPVCIRKPPEFPRPRP
jgi:hypothetical protein